MTEFQEPPEQEVEQKPEEATDPVPAAIESEKEFDAVVSLLRLLVGAGIEAPAELVERLKKWEETANEIDPEAELAESITPDALRYALVGFLFESQDEMRIGLSRFGRFFNASSQMFLRSIAPITQSRAMQPMTNRYERLVQRGEDTVNRWVERGRVEEPQGRLMAREALIKTIDEVINQLAENPEIRELVTTQSVGMAGEMVDGVRSRTVTADTLLERVARGLLNRPPREQLPPPTPEIVSQGSKITTILDDTEEPQ